MTLTINISCGTKRTVEPVETEHLWFDYNTGEMHKLRGGRLDFQYENGKVKPVAKPMNAVVYKKKDNLDSIKEWFKKNKSELSLEMESCDFNHCVFSFPDENKKDVDDAAYEERFDYEIE